MSRSRFVVATATLSLCLAPAASAYAGGTIHQDLNISGHLSAALDVQGCDNSGGPNIALSGDVVANDVLTTVIFRNASGKKEATVPDVLVDVALLTDQTFLIPKQPVKGGATGNPSISVIFTDGKNSTGEISLGRCKSPKRNVDIDLLLSAAADLAVDADGCSNSGGPNVTIDGPIVFQNLQAKFILRGGNHMASTDFVEADLVLFANQTISVRKGGKAGATGNPFVFFRFDEPLTDEVLLGRCNQL